MTKNYLVTQPTHTRRHTKDLVITKCLKISVIHKELVLSNNFFLF